nr:integrase, catalytic region, zinc finger, CCHC-type, peptidase aspartic, catalytic [Tanacetum cinerariifolium]
MFRVDRIEVRGPIHRVEVQLGLGEFRTEWGMLIQVKQDMLNAITAMDLALNMDNVFQADDCDAFDYDVDEAPTVKTMFMANLSSADPVNDEVGPSYDSDILSEVHDHNHYQDTDCTHHEEHAMHDNVQLNNVVDSHADYTSDSNMIPYVKDNAVPFVHSNVSSVPNDAHMMIYNDMYEPHAQSVSTTSPNIVVKNSLTLKLATYKEQVELYERRAKFELTKREQKINKQLRLVISDRNFKEETLKKELHSVKLQLASTINRNKLMVEEVTSLKKDFKQKENKYIEDFLDMKSLKEKVDIGYKNPLCLTRAKQIQPDLYNGHEIIKDNHVPAIERNTEDTLEIAEITRRKMNDKMKDPECVTHKEAHLDYLRHLKESVETMRDIVEEAKVKTNVPVPHSTGVNRYTDASGSQPRSNTKNNRISPAKGANKLHVEEQPRTNKSPLRTSNRVDSSSHPKRTVINSNSDSVCQTCNKCLIYANHDMCVVDYLQSVVAPPLFVIIVTLCVNLSKFGNPSKLGKYGNPQEKSLPVLVINGDPLTILWYLDSGCSKHMTGDRSRLMNFMKKFIGIVRFGNDHFGAIMGYGDYVIGDSVISKVYYVEGLGHNLFSVRQFCDADLEVAFKKHSCYVRDTDDVELIKGSRGSNLYTILVEDMMKSSPFCLLSKASKNKSWLWHRRLNHLNFVPRTPQQNGVVERRNRTLIEAARTMLIFSKAPMFLWAEAVATACYTQNRSLIHTHYNKTPYELVHKKKPDLTFFRVFGALCYPTNDSEDLGKLQPIADIGIFVGYTPSRKGYRFYNKRTRRIMETIHISSGLVPNPVPATPDVPPTNKDLEILFQPMFDKYLEPPRVERAVSPAQAVQAPVNFTGTPSSTTIDPDAPSPSISSPSSALQSHQSIAAESTFMEENPVAPVDNNPFINVFALEPSFGASSSGDVNSTEST